MSDDDDSNSIPGATPGDEDPNERYFRPRPGAEPAAGDDEEAAEQVVAGVAVGGSRAQRVSVEQRRRRSAPGQARRHWRMLTTAAALSSLVLLSSGGGWAFQDYVLGSIKRVDPFGGLRNRPDSGPEGSMNILVAGVDRREGLSDEQIKSLHLGHVGGQRSDTMMLVHLSAKHDKITVVSLPRDSLVTIPAHRSDGAEGPKGSRVGEKQGKLNWSYMYGGPTLAVQTVEKATGVHVDHYVEINFLGFLKIVNALGGVTVCTPQPVDDPKSGLRLPAGKSTVDGPTALAYTRARYTLTGGSDLGRIERQQQFMSAVAQKALSDPTRFPGFLNASLEAMRADKGLSRKTLSSLAMQMKGMKTDGVTFATVPLSRMGGLTRINGGPPQSTVQWDPDAAGKLFDDIQEDRTIVRSAPSSPPPASPSATPGGPTVPPGKIDVRVVNGVGTAGLAARAARDLEKAGFGATVVPGARHGVNTTVIQYGPSRADSAQTLKAAIPGARLKEIPSLGSRLQVVVGRGWDGVKRVKVAEPPNNSGSTNSQVRAKTATENLCK